MNDEHDDDLAPIVDERNEMEKEDYPNAGDDAEGVEPPASAVHTEDEDDDEDIIGK